MACGCPNRGSLPKPAIPFAHLLITTPWANLHPSPLPQNTWKFCGRHESVQIKVQSLANIGPGFDLALVWGCTPLRHLYRQQQEIPQSFLRTWIEYLNHWASLDNPYLLGNILCPDIFVEHLTLNYMLTK